jgi:hypothetical protein
MVRARGVFGLLVGHSFPFANKNGPLSAAGHSEGVSPF